MGTQVRSKGNIDLSSTSTLTQTVLWINPTATLCIGAWGGGGGLMFLSLYFLNIHLKPLFLKRVAEFNTAGGGGVHVWERM